MIWIGYKDKDGRNNKEYRGLKAGTGKPERESRGVKVRAGFEKMNQFLSRI
jgi:hypothetical protein